MIISHSQQFIFIANRKTASTAIGITFSSACNKSDVITPLGKDESIRRGLAYFSSAKLYTLEEHPFVSIPATTAQIIRPKDIRRTQENRLPYTYNSGTDTELFTAQILGFIL